MATTVQPFQTQNKQADTDLKFCTVVAESHPQQYHQMTQKMFWLKLSCLSWKAMYFSSLSKRFLTNICSLNKLLHFITVQIITNETKTTVTIHAVSVI